MFGCNSKHPRRVERGAIRLVALCPKLHLYVRQTSIWKGPYFTHYIVASTLHVKKCSLPGISHCLTTVIVKGTSLRSPSPTGAIIGDGMETATRYPSL